MTAISIFILGLIVGGAVVLIGYAVREAKRHGTKTSEELAGICASAIETASQKERRKQKIVELLREPFDSAQGKRELSNAEIRRALGVASRTAVRYLDELEREGKIEQIGKTGHAVTYRLK